MIEINREVAKKVLQTVDAGLVKGLGSQVPGHMCVEAAVCYALGLPHGDDPRCVAQSLRSLKIKLNDSNWSSDQSRSKGMRKLAILQLGTKETVSDMEFTDRLVMVVINKLLPIALRKLGLYDIALSCEFSNDVASSYTAVTSVAYILNNDIMVNMVNQDREAIFAAHYAANTARSYFINSVNSDYAAEAAEAAEATSFVVVGFDGDGNSDSDAILIMFAEEVSNILIDMNVPGVEWLDLL